MHDYKKQTGVYAPNYYGKFKCIADRCRHSCCVGWEICIDGSAYEKYKDMADIADTVTECEDGHCFRLGDDGRCPHLNECGLCDIILDHGEEYLSEICQNHPRFYNYMDGGRVEVGLGIVCEEACRLILEDEAPFSLSKIGETETEEGYADFDPLPIREHIISVIGSCDSFDSKVSALKAEFNIPGLYSRNEWTERFLSLEILDPEWEKLLRSAQVGPLEPKGAGDSEYEKYYERLLVYFVYRHVGVAEWEGELAARLGFAILSVEVIRALFEAGQTQTPAELMDISRRYSAEIEYSEDNTAQLIFDFETEF